MTYKSMVGASLLLGTCMALSGCQNSPPSQSQSAFYPNARVFQSAHGKRQPSTTANVWSGPYEHYGSWWPGGRPLHLPDDPGKPISFHRATLYS